jgi:UDPglucose 6-dehydrogenase
MALNSALVGDSDEGAYRDSSTAPTTPEGSLSFSPVLRPRNGETKDSERGGFTVKSHIPGISLSSATLDAQGRAFPVRNICCIGAGYVGKETWTYA